MASKRERPQAAVDTRDERTKATDRMLRALELRQDELNEWEREFVESVSEWFYDRGDELTTGQYLKLEEVYGRYF